jgi:hypothetical protein
LILAPPHGDDACASDDRNGLPLLRGRKQPYLFQYMLLPLSAEAWTKTEQQ